MINMKIKAKLSSNKSLGFTITELVVVVVIIGILAAISLVSYSGIQIRAADATLKSDLQNASTQLELDKTLTGAYPETEPEANGGKGLPKSEGTEYQYSVADGEYYLSATSDAAGDIAYYITSLTNTIAEGVWSGHTAPGGPSPIEWKQITTGSYNTCAISGENRAYCWGGNSNGTLGNNSITNNQVPVEITMSGVLSGKTIKSIASGYMHTCVIASDDLVYCWGFNDNGQLGNNSTTQSLVPVAVNTAGVLNGKTIKSIVTSYQHTCVIASDDLAYCWGYNNSGQLGNNSYSQSNVPVAVNMSGTLVGKTIKSISATSGGSHTCAISSDDLAYCWGLNTNGALGNNLTTASPKPVAVNTAGVLSGKTIKSITVGGGQSCAIASDNNAYCWGYNNYGQLGNNSTTRSLVPVAVNTAGVLNGKTLKSISSGNNHSCVIASDDKVYCWGYGNYGQLGYDSIIESWVPVAVNTAGVLNSKTIVSITNGNNHTCAIDSDDIMYCWGINSRGQLGNNSLVQSNVPVSVSISVLRGKTIKSFDSGHYFNCAIASDDLVYCWGQNGVGQLGNNSTIQSLIPVAVNTDGALNGKTIKSITVGGTHACVIASDNLAYCWGYNSFGQLGDNSTANTPVPVAVNTGGVLGGKTIKSITAGDRHTCAIASDDLAYCWGYNNYGQIGDNSIINSQVPTAVNTTHNLSLIHDKTVKAISAGSYHTCAIASDDLVYCWGLKYINEWGDIIFNSIFPVAAINIANKTIKSISSAGYRTCEVTSDDLVYCLGNTHVGNFALNTMTYSSGSCSVGSPYCAIPWAVDTTTVLSGKTIKYIGTGNTLSCAIASDNLAYCWDWVKHSWGADETIFEPVIPTAVDTSGYLSGKTFKSISGGSLHTCAIASDNLIYCWGKNEYGQFGNGSVNISSDAARSAVPVFASP